MIDHHTQERQAWLKTFREPKKIAWDVLAVLLGAALILISAIAGGYQ